jgi:hypothetical protein
MLDRELVLLLTSQQENDSGLDAIRALGLRLSLTRYGFPSGWTSNGISPADDLFTHGRSKIVLFVGLIR